MLYLGAFLLLMIGAVHSVLGERYILIRLFRRDNLPSLFGSDWFTKRVLRFAWHLTTVAWWGFAGVLIVLATPGAQLSQAILSITALVFFVSGLLSGGFSRWKHLSWVVFWAVAAIALSAALAI